MYENRIKHLEEAHHALDKRIRGLEATGVYDDEQLHELKKQKLKLKDDIEELKRKYENGPSRT